MIAESVGALSFGADDLFLCLCFRFFEEGEWAGAEFFLFVDDIVGRKGSAAENFGRSSVKIETRSAIKLRK